MFKIIWSTNTFKRKFLWFNCHSLNSEEHVDEKNNINNTLIHKSVTCSNVLSCKHNSALIADETLHSCCIHTTWGCAWRRIIPVPNISREIISSMWRVILCDLTPSTSLFWHQSISRGFQFVLISLKSFTVFACFSNLWVLKGDNSVLLTASCGDIWTPEGHIAVYL